MPRCFIGLGILLGSLLGVLFTGYSVSAASAYDNTVNVTDELILHDSNDVAYDFSQDWYVEIIDALTRRCNAQGGNWCTNRDAVEDILTTENANWLVVNPNLDTMGRIALYWSYDINAFTEFYDVSGTPSFGINSNSVYYVTNFYVDPGGTYSTEKGLRANNSTLFEVTNPRITYQGDPSLIFLSTFPLTYPSGYEGQIIPDSYSPEEVPKVDLQPDFNLKVDTKGNVNLKYADNLDWDFQKGASISVNKSDSGCSAGDLINLYTYDNYGEIDLSFELEEAGWYTINVVTTETGILPWKTCFNWQGQEINISAINCTTINDFYTCKEIDPEEIYNQCMNSDFPFIHIKDCMAAFGRITSTLSFGTINPLDQFSYESSASCRQLNVLDDWISRPDQVICAQFPSSIRDTVTPFVTFGLSLTVLGYMINRTSKDVS